MSVEYRFVVMEGDAIDYPAEFRAAADRLGLPAEIDVYPHVRPRHFSRAKLQDIRNRLKRRHRNEIVGFCPGALELFVEGADMTFCFSSYRSWYDPETTRVIPHPWSLVPFEGNRDQLEWKCKPPLSIGFLGSTYTKSRAARLVGNGLPTMRNWLISGRLVQDVDRYAWLDEHGLPHRFLATFVRSCALDAIEHSHRRRPVGTLKITDSHGFDGSHRQVEAFAEHLARTTYVLCPRGCENYSFRVFEALRFGRVPVIIDSDMVLPPAVDWAKLALVIPYERIGDALDLIVRDHEERSPADFIQRQEAAFACSDWLNSDNWLAEEIGAALERRGLLNAEARCVA